MLNRKFNKVTIFKVDANNICLKNLQKVSAINNVFGNNVYSHTPKQLINI